MLEGRNVDNIIRTGNDIFKREKTVGIHFDTLGVK
jgi:hypothetical protein